MFRYFFGIDFGMEFERFGPPFWNPWAAIWRQVGPKWREKSAKWNQNIDISKKMADPVYNHARAFVAINLLYWHLEEGPKNRNPIPEFVKSFKKAIAILSSVLENEICSKSYFRETSDEMGTGTGQIVDAKFEEKISPQ